MKKIFLFTLFTLLGCLCWAESQPINFYQTKELTFPKVPVFSDSLGYGYDLNTSWDGKAKQPFFVSFKVPDGNYRITLTLGSKKRAASTTVRCESRRLYVENLTTAKGKFETVTFVVNKRNIYYTDAKGQTGHIKIKTNEGGKLHWDEKVTLEFNGDAPAVQNLRIEPDTLVPTLYLCGNSTVVDQSNEPWASWGQMVPRFLTDQIAVANYAESGLAIATFIGQNRWAKIRSLLRKGDYVVLEFGHNDQKTDSRPGNGAFYAFSHQVKEIYDECKALGATFILCTPTMRRSFQGDTVVNTHVDYPEAIHAIAEREDITLIDLQAMTKTFYEAMGPTESTKAFVHYPANTWPGQDKALADNTHFNPYGAYEIAKMVIMGIKHSNLTDLKARIVPSFTDFDPAHPDAFESFHWSISPFVDIVKPDGN